jgi:hypothetical protein
MSADLRQQAYRGAPQSSQARPGTWPAVERPHCRERFNAGRQHQRVPACPPDVLSGAESIVRSRRFTSQQHPSLHTVGRPKTTATGPLPSCGELIFRKGQAAVRL